MPPIPLYLILITLLLVVIPSLFTIFLRISLYLHLINLTNEVQRLIKTRSAGGQRKIIQTLEARFQEASKQLEQVNTGALIDQIYSQETIKGFTFTCEQIDYLCRILPNLLLAFGLLGTFLV
jgi:biopolymer transport protein ExbB/TolQ